MEGGTFERYPAWVVIVSNLISLSVCLAGVYLLYLIWPLFALLFVIYMIYLEVSVYREGCVRCYYYGKRCFSGRGKIAKLLFKKDEKRKFYEREVKMKHMIPSFLPMVITLIAGIYLVIQGLPNINFMVIGIAIWPLIVMFFGNPIIYGKLSCPHCKQREFGCPSCEFFMKMEKKGKK
jgi:hypothetical protein